MHEYLFCNEIFVSDTDKFQSNGDLLWSMVLKSIVRGMSGIDMCGREGLGESGFNETFIFYQMNICLLKTFYKLKNYIFDLFSKFYRMIW